ncbi:MucBP domain-containing protein [Enterococcus crotali]|uniref:MucBP domain-containing protein n=1 Tax=Enterococcus crotali TaxID=1453587 RepID=UPI00046FA7B8|nr:MucBP domain-containing protein [Enterococcus crotali]
MKRTFNLFVLTLLLFGQLNFVTAYSTDDPPASQTDLSLQSDTVALANIATGTWGTSAWYLTTDGILHIGAGQLANTINQDSPWINWGNMIFEIIFDGPVIAPTNSEALFSNFVNLTSIQNIGYLDTSNVTTMRRMFYQNNSIQSLDLSSFNMSNVTNTEFMFGYTNALTSLNTTGWNTGNITSMEYMFYYTALPQLDLSHWDTSKVISMREMFSNAQSLQSLNVATWNTSNVSMMSSMFANDVSLESLDLSGWSTSPSTNIVAIFNNTVSMWKLTLPNTFDNLLISVIPEVPTNSIYTGKWQSVGTGTPLIPNGQHMLTSDELANTFNGLTMAETYVWQPNTRGTVIAQYLDSDGNELSPPETFNGDLRAAYITQQKVIAGYTLKEIVGQPTGLYSTETIVVTYVYVKDAAPIIDGTVLTQYLDDEGNEIAPSNSTNGPAGSDYLTEQLTIDGYTFKEVVGNPSGQYTDTTITVKYIYYKNQLPVKDATIIVEYVDVNGNELTSSLTLNGAVGTNYTTEQKEIDGYTFKNVEGDVSGTFTDLPITIRYIYTKNTAPLMKGTVVTQYFDDQGIN